jgi:hypothetical protein
MRPWLAAPLFAACSQGEPESNELLVSSNAVVEASAAAAPATLETKPESARRAPFTKDIYALHAPEIMDWTRAYAAKGLEACTGKGPWKQQSPNTQVCFEYFTLAEGPLNNVVTGVVDITDKDQNKQRSVSVGFAIESVSCDVSLTSNPSGKMMTIEYGGSAGGVEPEVLYKWTRSPAQTNGEESRPGLAGEAEFAQQWFSTH